MKILIAEDEKTLADVLMIQPDKNEYCVKNPAAEYAAGWFFAKSG